MSYWDIEIEVERVKLLKILEENREKHPKVYGEALKEWRKHLSRFCSELDVSSLSGIPSELRELNKSTPRCYVEDYDDAIGMLQISVDDHIKLCKDKYKYFVKDEWKWSHDVNENRYYSTAKKTLGV